MSKEIWLPDSKTHVVIEDGKVKVWDSMVMVREELSRKKLGFEAQEIQEESEKIARMLDV